MSIKKQTMINGVDVSGCDHYEPEQTEDCWAYPDMVCENNPNCYYKQLKKKEQECEKLTNQYNAVVEQNRQLQSRLKNLREIQNYCNETLKTFSADSDKDAYAGGRCIEAEGILQIIGEVIE